MFCMKNKKYIISLTLLGIILTTECLLRKFFPVVPSGSGTLFVPKAKIYGWALPPSTKLFFINPDTGEKIFYTTNSSGWKDVEHSIRGKNSVIRIMVVGDSVTWGLVPTGYIYTRQLAKILKDRGFKIEVVSMGVPGFGTDQVLEVIKHEGKIYKPDIVIYQFCGNDLTDNLMPDSNTSDIHLYKPFKYILRNRKLIKLKLSSPASMFFAKLKYAIKAILFKSALLFYLNELKNKVFYRATYIRYLKNTLRRLNFIYKPNRNSRALTQAWQLFEALIVLMKKEVLKLKAKFLIFSEEGDEGKRQYFLRWNFFKTDGKTDYFIKNNKKVIIDTKTVLKRLKQVCQKYQIPLISPKRVYYRYKYDTHPDIKGNKQMAHDIAEYLIQNKYLEF